jgi:hypothetical protein
MDPIELISGYYIRSRDLNTSFLYGKTPAAKLTYDYLLSKASHQKRIVEGKTFERGQCLARIDEIREALSWNRGWKKEMFTRDEIKTALRNLRDNSMIATRKTTRGMVITICYYEYYQDPKSYERTKETPDEDTSTAPTKAPDSPHYIQELKPLKKGKKESGAAVPPFEEGYDTPSPQKKPILLFPQPWNDFISLYETQDYCLYAELVSLESIEDGPNGGVCFTGSPFTVQQLRHNLKDIEANASAYFGKPVEINLKTQNSPQKEQAHG